MPPPPPPNFGHNNSIQSGVGGNDMMSAIKGGIQLKSRENWEEKSDLEEGGHSDLLSEIRQGMKLRSVEERKKDEKEPPAASAKTTLAAILANAMKERQISMNVLDDGNANEDDYGWSDDE